MTSGGRLHVKNGSLHALRAARNGSGATDVAARSAFDRTRPCEKIHAFYRFVAAAGGRRPALPKILQYREPGFVDTNASLHKLRRQRMRGPTVEPKTGQAKTRSASNQATSAEHLLHEVESHVLRDGPRLVVALDKSHGSRLVDALT